MTDKHPETSPMRKVRVSPSCPPVGDSEYWDTHVRICGCDEDPTCDAAEQGLDEWIAARRHRDGCDAILAGKDAVLDYLMSGE